MIDFSTLIARRLPALTEGSIYERLRRDPEIALDAEIRHGGLVYLAPEKLAALHRGYFDVARAAHLPMLALTDTWRTSAERIAASAFAGRPVNRDSVVFLRRLCADYNGLYVGGLMGCRGDAYRPGEALSEAAATDYHRPQAEALAEAGPDFLIASTLPAVSEACGLAQAMAATGCPFLISFVVRRNGCVLDGTPLAEAVARIDDAAPPAGYAINCVHPTVAAAALERLRETSAATLARVVCFQANTSDLDPDALNNIAELQTEAPEDLAREMRAVRDLGVPVLGGCCGTDERHIAEIGRLFFAHGCRD